MAAVNTIKLAQMATGELAAFFYSGVGIISGTNLQHSYTEEFLSNLGIGGNAIITGNLTVNNSVTILSGLTVNTGIQVRGQISGQSLTIDNFSLNSGSLGTATIGAFNLTGIPIYDSGNVSVGLALPSGAVFGLKQKVNEPRFVYDASGNLQPYTGVGSTVVMLCVSLG
jgi:hypothetical protein